MEYDEILWTILKYSPKYYVVNNGRQKTTAMKYQTSINVIPHVLRRAHADDSTALSFIHFS